MSAKKVFAIILAAGRGSRFGGTKQLQEYQGTSLVLRAVRLGEEISGPRTILVTGNDWSEVATASAPLRGFLCVNSEYDDGIASSIACGVRSVAAVADAVLIILADQPLISSAHLHDLVAAWAESKDSIVASAYSGTSGPPVIFPRRDFSTLAALRGDRGARSIIDSSADRVRLIEFEDAAIDIDRPEDLPPGY